MAGRRPPCVCDGVRLCLQPGDVGSPATHCYCYVPGSCGRQTAALRLRRSQTSPTTRRCGLACDTLLLLCSRILWPADGRPAFVTESDSAYNQEMWARLRHIVIVMFQDPVAGRRPPCVCDGVRLRLQPGDVGSPAKHHARRRIPSRRQSNLLHLVYLRTSAIYLRTSPLRVCHRPRRHTPRDLPLYSCLLAARGPDAPPGDQYALCKLQMADDMR